MKILKIALLILSLVMIMTSCSKKQTSSEATDETTGETTSSNVVVDGYELQIEYYSELLTSLQDDMSELKADKFMLEANYKAEIEELKKEIDELKKSSSSGTNSGSSAGTNNGTSGGTNSGTSGGTNSGNTTNGNVDHNVYPEQFDPTATELLYKYEVINKKLTITEYIGNKLSAKIPQTVDGISIRKIGDDAFKNSNLQSVVIADGIEEIGWFAFWGCSSLKSIEIPPSVTLVGYGAFEYCSPSLTIICEKGSYIDIYAQSWGIRVEYK